MIAACLMLSLAATPGLSAERRARKSNVQRSEESARPVYRSRTSGDDTDFSSECVGGYRWIRQFYDSNLTAAQVSVPVRCR